MTFSGTGCTTHCQESQLAKLLPTDSDLASWVMRAHVKLPKGRAMEPCESPGGCPGLPIPNKPYAFCRHKATPNLLKGCGVQQVSHHMKYTQSHCSSLTKLSTEIKQKEEPKPLGISKQSLLVKRCFQKVSKALHDT